MNPALETPTISREFVCEHCGQTIETSELIHLRECYALPEESTFHVHNACADPFIEDHPGDWREIARNSADAGWLLY